MNGHYAIGRFPLGNLKDKIGFGNLISQQIIGGGDLIVEDGFLQIFMGVRLGNVRFVFLK